MFGGQPNFISMPMQPYGYPPRTRQPTPRTNQPPIVRGAMAKEQPQRKVAASFTLPTPESLGIRTQSEGAATPAKPLASVAFPGPEELGVGKARKPAVTLPQMPMVRR